MNIQKRVVAVKLLPAILNSKNERLFLAELQAYLNVARPRIVLDGTLLRKLDRSGIHLLLCCLEEAIKRNGDVKLAALPPGTEALLEFTGVSRVFEIYDTTVEAVNSFDALPGEVIYDRKHATENAA